MYLHLFWDHSAHIVYFENWILIKPVLGAYAALQTTAALYEKT